jgi:hypothetical protein
MMIEPIDQGHVHGLPRERARYAEAAEAFPPPRRVVSVS